MKNFLLGLIASCAILVAASSFSSTANASPVTSLMSWSWIQELSHRVDTIKVLAPAQTEILVPGPGEAFVITHIGHNANDSERLNIKDSQGNYLSAFDVARFSSSTLLVLNEGERLSCDTAFTGYLTGFWVNR